MSQEKHDTGSLTLDNRKENTGRRGRAWAALIIPAGILVLAGGAVSVAVGLQGEKKPAGEEVKEEPPPLPALASDGFVSTPQAVGPAQVAPIPPEVEQALKKLEDRQEEMRQTQEQGAGAFGGAASPKPKRVRVVSSVTIARPDTSQGAAGGIQQASLTSSEGGSESEPAGSVRKGGIYSKNKLEKPFKCQASAGTLIPLSLPEGFNTEQEGEVTARVTANSYSRDKSCLTIPVDSYFHGHYKTEVVRGSSRVSVTFEAIERPPPLGDTIMLDKAKAYERDGKAGLTGEVNSNIPWGLIIASTVIDLGSTALGNLGGGTDINIGGAIANNAGSVLRDVARDRYQKAPATIDVAPHAILVRLDKHLEMKPFPEQ